MAYSMATIARKCWVGLPYLHKEITQELSIKTGAMLAKPMCYYVFCTSRCNFKCAFCPQTTQRSSTDPELPGEVMFRIIQESRRLSGRGYHISVSGGETLLYEPIYEAMELAQKLGVDFGITTNGYLLTEEAIKRIVGADIFNINISLESIEPSVNELLRPTPGATNRVLKAIDDLLAEKERHNARFGIFIKPTITELNYRSLPKMVKHFGKGAKVQVNPQTVFMFKGGEHFWVKDIDEFAHTIDELVALRQEGYSLVPSEKTLRDMVAYFQSKPSLGPVSKRNGNPQPCRIGFKNIFIEADGAVSFCSFLGTIGNVLNTSLHDIWYGPEAGEKRQQALKCQFDCQMACLRQDSFFAKVKAFLQMK